MMEDGLLSLKWNNHKSTFFEILRHLRDKSKYTDATVAVESKFYPVHKLVLSTCSEYFNEIFDKTPCKSPVIVLKDVRSQDLEALLDYMYLGEVNVNQNDLGPLLKTAECLRIKGLAVPDEDPSKPTNKPTTDNLHSPPSKRRKRDVSAEPPVRSLSPALKGHSSLPPQQTQDLNVPALKSNLSQEPSIEPVPLVKVELDEPEDQENNFIQDTEYESPNRDSDARDYNITKTEVPSPAYSTENYSATQHMSDIAWDEGESTSFQSETYTGDNTQPAPTDQGGEDEEVDVTSVEDPIPPGDESGASSLPPSITQMARVCQLCNVTLANANLLRRHVEDHHFHIRKYDCTHCGKKFKRKEHKERHERIHTGEKPFACSICTARFTQKEHLKGHVDNVHNKYEKDKENDNYEDEKDLEKDSSVSSPPSLASPSSIASMVTSSTSSIASFLPHSLPNSPSSLLIMPSSSSTSPYGSSFNTLIPGPSTSTPADPSNQVTALYAPVTRKTANSPNKHVQTITINFN